MTRGNADYLASLITAASDAVRHTCHRDFTLTSYTEYHNGSGAAQPCGSASSPSQRSRASRRSPTRTPRDQPRHGHQPARHRRDHPDRRPALSRRLRRPDDQRPPVRHYPTIAQLASAIIALGNGWSATVQPQSITGDFARWPSADLKPLQGAATAFQGGATLDIYTEDLQPFLALARLPPRRISTAPVLAPGWRLDDETGELVASFPRGRLNVRIDYTAGYPTVPEPVQEACVQLAQDLYQAALVNSTLKKATLGAAASKCNRNHRQPPCPAKCDCSSRRMWIIRS